MKKRKGAFKGFTIVEMAVALAVISLLLGTSIAFTSARIAAQKLQTTKDRMNTITESIRMFAIHHGSLPCPADGSLASSNASFGIGQRTGTSGSVCNAGNLLTVTVAGSRVVQGVVPTGTLGLSPENMMDGWSRRFSYMIDERYAQTTSPTFWDAGCVCGTTGCTNQSGKITVCSTQDATGLSAGTCGSTGTRKIVPRDPENLGAIFSVISHGPSGTGAWRGQGGTPRLGNDASFTVPTNYPKRENSVITLASDSSADDNFDELIVQSAAETGYDDIVEYRLKWQICDRRVCQCQPQ